MARMLAPRLESAEVEGAGFAGVGREEGCLLRVPCLRQLPGSLGHIHVRPTPCRTSSPTSSQFLLGPE